MIPLPNKGDGRLIVKSCRRDSEGEYIWHQVFRLKKKTKQKNILYRKRRLIRLSSDTYRKI